MGARAETLRIPSRDPGRFITADLYSPHSTDLPKGILINWHGSGFILPLHRMNNVFCAHVAQHAGIYVLDADYRKSPETPFPGPLEDAHDVTRWAVAQADRFDKTRLAVSGFSAGATIALALAIEPPPESVPISAAVVLYPFTDMSIAPEAKTVPNPINAPPPSIGHIFNDSYAFDKSTRTNPLISPGLADPSKFPGTVGILTCDGDILEPEGTALARKLEDGGKKVSLNMMKGVPHSFDTGVVEGTFHWQKREEAYKWAVEVLKDALRL
ncbi:alpha beta-hydrolase [Fusarium albosuccineum]|uniref:Alpha beta-hydrolase n=1 Tax=Fusarium albosuccineum TaxID=1237068 RepID=A0A8H4L192_9HYPO|nr:alpha beta-hydrolase [Fusarium albosuccineum]